jgi:transcriptional antiterminator NusG
MENSIASNINSIDDSINAIAPVRVLSQKRKGIWEQREQILLPGYIFVFSEDKIGVNLRSKVSNIYKVLQYQTGFRELGGADYEYSMWIYRNRGNITPSKVLEEGSSIRVVEGPLADGFGTIIKLDKHKRRVWIEFEFDGQKRVISLSAECIAATED